MRPAAKAQEQVGDVGAELLAPGGKDPVDDAEHIQELGDAGFAEGEDLRLHTTELLGADGQLMNLGIGEFAPAEHRQGRRHRDLGADHDVFERSPPGAGEQRMGRRDPHRPPGPGRHLEHRLAAVVVELRKRGRLHLAEPVEGEAVDGVAGGAEAVPLLSGANGTTVGTHHGRVPGHALAHCRPGTDDVERARLQPRQKVVEVVVTSGQAGDDIAPLVGLLQGIHRERHQVAERAHRVDDAILGNLEHLGFGLVEGLGDIVGFVVGKLGDLRGHSDQTPQHRGVLHDLGVTRHVGDRWGRVLQLKQEFGAADFLEQAGSADLVGHGDGVDRITGGVQSPDRVVDVLMGGLVEVRDGEAHLGHSAHRLARQQQRTEQGLLRVQVVGWNAPIAAADETRPIAGVVELRHVPFTLPREACASLEAQPCDLAVNLL